MTEDEVWQRLTSVFRDVFEDDEITLTPETTAEDIEDWDSLTNIQLLIAIEKAFSGLEFSTGEVANLQNVGDLVSAITKRVTA
ncbi:acyl carrier protein [Ruegeria arenilitoris]|uniref:acyl carrier protein n=1 Tax=Ruegeria arenilitoris TaxID=1173585 RepID=UPI001CFC711B|nr:acyl carrier protein [Ruegeria arenilitoris]